MAAWGLHVVRAGRALRLGLNGAGVWLRRRKSSIGGARARCMLARTTVRSGEDELRGNAGNDRLRGDDDNDLLVGGKGNDVLHGGPGIDICNGGAGENKIRRCEL